MWLNLFPHSLLMVKPMFRRTFLSMGLLLTIALSAVADPPPAPGNLTGFDQFLRDGAIAFLNEAFLYEGEFWNYKSYCEQTNEDLVNLVQAAASAGYNPPNPPGDRTATINALALLMNPAYAKYQLGDNAIAAGDSYGPGSNDRQQEYIDAELFYKSARDDAKTARDAAQVLDDQILADYNAFEDAYAEWISQQQ